MARLGNTPFIVGATAHNAHVQHIARSLHEVGALRAFVTGAVDSARSSPMRTARAAVRAVPALARQLNSRAVTQVPADLVYSHWGWEVPRLIAGRIIGSPRAEDWAWDHGERLIDRQCAKWMSRADVRAFLGVEYGSLAALRAARALDKPGIVAFLSPHHRTRARWVDVELERFPELLPNGRTLVENLSPIRDARRDEEARTAAWIETGSSFTTRSLVNAGFPPEKILTVPLGGPDPVDERRLPVDRPTSTRVIYGGPVSVRKGAHYLLRAWSRIAGSGAELHFYGQNLLADKAIRLLQEGARRPSVVFHGSVPATQLSDVYLSASVLVLPTLCDGFGMVVSEALAHGLPVVTTANAGAADLIEHGVNGFVIPPADEDALADILQWCVDHPRELHEMRLPTLKAAGRWTWADFRRRHIDLLDCALQGRGSTSLPPRVAAGARQ